LHGRDLVIVRLRLAALADQLVDRRHRILFTLRVRTGGIAPSGHLVRAGKPVPLSLTRLGAPPGAKVEKKVHASGALIYRACRKTSHEPETLHPNPRGHRVTLTGAPLESPARLRKASGHHRQCSALSVPGGDDPGHDCARP